MNVLARVNTDAETYGALGWAVRRLGYDRTGMQFSLLLTGGIDDTEPVKVWIYYKPSFRSKVSAGQLRPTAAVFDWPGQGVQNRITQSARIQHLLKLYAPKEE